MTTLNSSPSPHPRPSPVARLLPWLVAFALPAACATTVSEGPRSIHHVESRELEIRMQVAVATRATTDSLTVRVEKTAVRPVEERTFYQTQTHETREVVGLSGVTCDSESDNALLILACIPAIAVDIAVIVPAAVVGVSDLPDTESTIDNPPEPGPWRLVRTESAGETRPVAGASVLAGVNPGGGLVFERGQTEVEGVTGEDGQLTVPLTLLEGYVARGDPELNRLRSGDLVDRSVRIDVEILHGLEGVEEARESEVVAFYDVRAARAIRSEFEAALAAAQSSLDSGRGAAAIESLQTAQRIGLDLDRTRQLRGELRANYREVRAKTDLYEEPSGFASVVGSADGGTVVQHLGSEGDWARVQVATVQYFVPLSKLQSIQFPANRK